VQARFFILGRLCEHAELDVMALVEALQGDAGAVRIGGAKPVSTPLKGGDVLEHGQKCMQIEGKPGDHHRAIFCPTDELHGGGIDHECPVCLLL
jgi:hypothetical protein